MQFIRRKVLDGTPMFGFGAQLGCSPIVEMIGIAGFDYVWIDCEHGHGDFGDLLQQLQAAGVGATPAVVRVRDNDPNMIKQVLDLGAAGVMVPFVNTAAEAAGAVRAVRYPPGGIRGVALASRCHAYGASPESYFREANDNLLTVVQVEREEAVRNCRDIAAVDGVDVLFVGPVDLSHDLGVPLQFSHPRFAGALNEVIAACREHGKAAGLLATDPERLVEYVEIGFSFLVVGADGMLLTQAMRKLRERCDKARDALAPES